MKISQNLLRWALAGLTAASSISSAQVQPPAQNMFNFSSKSLSDLRADVEKANALVNTKKSEVLSARNALLANAGFAQLNPLYKEALKLNITPEKFDINVIAQRRDIVKSVYDAMMEQGRRPGQPYFSTWWGDGRTGPSVQHIPNYIAFLAHARVRQAYLTGKSASDTAAVNAVFVDVSTWEDKLQNEALLQLPWPGRTVIQEGGKVRFTDGLALFGDGQYLWTAWGADPGKGTIERNCSSGDRTFSDALKDVRKICMVISGSEIRTRGTLCAKGATCSLADPRFSSLAGPRFIYAVYDGGYGLVGAGPSKCGTSGDCTVLPLEPFGYGYQAFVGAWTRVID